MFNYYIKLGRGRKIPKSTRELQLRGNLRIQNRELLSQIQDRERYIFFLINIKLYLVLVIS